MEPDNIIDFAVPGKPGASPKAAHGRSQPMRSDLVEQASKVIKDPPLLINVVSKRVKELNLGRSPLVTVSSRMGTADIALLEIIEGKVVIDEQED
jgi:DNA-directed RNA polymerase subunit omega